MANVLNFYMDDSGTRHPDHKPPQDQPHNRDWFALGGILVTEADEPELRERYAAFREKWRIDYPLHSSDIRYGSRKFLWLKRSSAEDKNVFMESLAEFLLSLPVVGLACVIDRPGYNSRYLAKYGRKRWSLCKTAFAIAVERATKYAIKQGARLRVMPERCSKKEDRKLAEYYRALRETGHPFDEATSEKYGPLSAAAYKSTLYEFQVKAKTSPPMQVADLYLWPICMGGYHKNNRPYQMLKEARKLIDCHYSSSKEVEALGTKYSCFDLVKVKP